MTVEQGATEPTVRIRMSSREWALPLIVLVGALVPAALLGNPERWYVRLTLVLAVLVVAQALLLRSFGVDLTPESANVRGFRRRSVPWHEVQAVMRYDELASQGVRLVLEDGTSVTLRAPTATWGLGVRAYERDYHRIGQWWLAHRGAAWRPVRPEAPRH